MPRRDQSHTPSHADPPVQDVAIDKGVSLGVILVNFKVGIGQESTVGYRERRRDTQLVGLAAGREESLIRVLDVGG